MTKLKLNYNLLLAPALAVICISLFSGFAAPMSDEDTVQALLTERAYTLQDGLFDVISHYETEVRLRDIETYPLLEDDIGNLKALDATDFDRVIRMRCIDIDKKHSIMGYITYEVDIIWDMRSPEGDYETRGLYHTVVKRSGDKLLLSKFVPLN